MRLQPFDDFAMPERGCEHDRCDAATVFGLKSRTGIEQPRPNIMAALERNAATGDGWSTRRLVANLPR